jgi:hypothetical protein
MSRPNGYTAAWTPGEDAYLRENYGKIPTQKIAAALGRSVKAVYGHAALEGGVHLHDSRPWTAAEENAIRENLGLLPASEIGRLINRTARAVNHRVVLTLGLRQEEALRSLSAAKLAELHHAHDAAAIPQCPPQAPARTPWNEHAVTRKTLITLSTVHGYFRDVVSVEQAYILGLLAADGNVASKHPRIIFGLKAEDAYLVEWVRDRLNPRAVPYRTKKGFAKIQITSRQMTADLARFGIVPRKSRTLQWPSHLGPLLPFFLLGYFDGDGWIYTVRGKYPGWGACSGSRQFLVDMKDYILAMTGVTMEKIHHRPDSSLWQVATTGRGAYLLDEWLHLDGLGLPRKRIPEHVLARYRPIS